MRRLILTSATTLLASLLLAAPAWADWIWPLRGEVITPYRNGADPYASGQHRGIDIAGDAGAAVVAAAGGEVRFAGTAGSSGLTVSVRTADGRYDTSYLHLSSSAVRKGDQVGAGQRIGTVGTTGTRSSERPHLHFGVRDAGSRHAYHDPLGFLPPPGAPPDPPREAPAPQPAPVPLGPAPAPEPVRVPAGRRVPVRVPAGRRVPVRVPAGGRVPVRVPAGGRVPVRAPAGRRVPVRTPTAHRVPARAPGAAPVPAPAVRGVPIREPAGRGVPRRQPAHRGVPSSAPLLPSTPLRGGGAARADGSAAGSETVRARSQWSAPESDSTTHRAPDLGLVLACVGLLTAAVMLGLTEDGRAASRRSRDRLARMLQPVLGRR